MGKQSARVNSNRSKAFAFLNRAVDLRLANIPFIAPTTTLTLIALIIGGAMSTPKSAADEFPTELVDFVPAQNNPLFQARAEGHWDAKIRERGWILKEDDVYHMWYTGYANAAFENTRQLGYATSTDGLSWTRYPGNPIFDELWVEDMCVVKHDGTYYMFAEDESRDQNNVCLHRPHLLTSTDRIHWKAEGELDMRRATGNPLKIGLYGTPTVWIEGQTWYLLYELMDTGIWLATSPDGKVWTNVQDDPVMSPGPGFYDKKFVAVNQLIKYKNRYYIYYHGLGDTDKNWTTNVATSTDLIDWKKYPQNPILPVESNKSSGILVHDGEQYRLYTMHDQVHVHYPRNPSSDDKPEVTKHRLLFEAYENDNWDLFIMHGDGSGRRNLTNTPDVHEMYPQASPDGSRICFLADVQQDGDTLRSVYYMNADGSGRTKVAEKARQPCWSPDGTRIAFVKQFYDRFRVEDHVSKGLFIHNLESGRTSKHINEKIQHLYGLSWTGDGVWIVSTVHGGMGYGHAILAIEVGGKRVHDLKIGGCRPCLSPDGRQVTWSRDDHTICVGDVELTKTVGKVLNVRVLEQRKKAHLYHPDFSPDGKHIAFSVGPGGRVLADKPGTHTQVAEMVGVRGKWNVFVKQADGEGNAIQLTDDESLSNKEPEWLRSE